jgi:hypothetical protein
VYVYVCKYGTYTHDIVVCKSIGVPNKQRAH